MKARQILLMGSILGGLGVALGAFGAHWLEGAVKEWGLTLEEQASRREIWETAVRYQMYHALALLATGWIASRGHSRCASWAAVLFVFGTLVFSGCLYALVISGVKILGAIVPIGGTSLIIGWILMAIAAGKQSDVATG